MDTSASVAMLYQDPHPAHRGFAEAVGADLVDYRRLPAGPFGDTLVDDVYNGLRYPEYDIYITEGSRPLYAAVVTRALRNGRLVYLCADHGLYELGRGDFAGDSTVKSLIGRFGVGGVRAVSRRFVDGVISVSEFAAEFTEPFVGPDTPVTVAHPYVQPDVFERLRAVDPTLDRPVAVTVAQGARYKGVDLLVDAWPTVRERHPEAELHVVGRGHPESYADTAGVTVRGFVDDLADALADASLYVQPSRMDTFPVATLEALCAGLPPLVTTRTGTRSVAREVAAELVVEPTADALATGVADYFDRSAEERATLSTTAREHGATFDEATRTAAFAEAFEQVVREL